MPLSARPTDRAIDLVMVDRHPVRIGHRSSHKLLRFSSACSNRAALHAPGPEGRRFLQAAKPGSGAELTRPPGREELPTTPAAAGLRRGRALPF
jgi:hypothetical protein